MIDITYLDGAKQKISPKGDKFGLFYLMMLGTAAGDYTIILVKKKSYSTNRVT